MRLNSTLVPLQLGADAMRTELQHLSSLSHGHDHNDCVLPWAPLGA